MSLRIRPTARRLLRLAAAPLAGLWLAAVPAPAAGATADLDRPLVARAAAGPGVVVEDFEHGVPTELLALDEGLAPALLAVGNDETVRIADWPVGPERREAVVLTRRDVYAPGARILRVDGRRTVEVPRSRLVFFWGAAELDEETRVLVSIDPGTGAVEGMVDARQGRHELRRAPGLETARGRAIYRLAPPEVFFAPGEDPEAQPFSCGAAETPQAMPLVFESAPSSAIWEEAITSLHTATVAVDTDNEFMALKFSNNTTAAANYIAQLFAAMNVFYERDLLVRLVQGTTFLRVSTTADPWTGGSGAADSAKLQQFSNYWSANMGGVGRAVAAMLSGKGSSGSSGIAWLNGLCSTGSGYSFSQVFLSSTNGSQDAFVVGHEIGHNFGSNHTHCYLTPTPIDTCYNGQSGCYSGATSCPAPATMNGVPNVRGTLMSYCHLIGGCSADRVFHPRTVDLLAPIIQSRVGACIFPAATGPTVAGVSPASGPTAGGTPITITGTGFQAGATVALGGVAAGSVVVVSPTRITAVTGAHATGAVSAVVTNPGNLSGTRANAFFYTPPAPASAFYTLTPCRLLDTRNPNGPLGGPALGASAQRTFDATGTCGVPNGAQAISVNVTAVAPAATGSLTFYPGNAFPFGTNTISFRAGVTRANNAILQLATNGAGTFGVQNLSAGGTHFIVDVNGYFQ